MKTEKERLRREYKKIRDNLTPEAQTAKSIAVWKYFFDLEEYETCKTVMLYSNIKSEVRTDVFAQRLFCDRKRVIYPLTDPLKNEIHPIEITSLSQLERGNFGILEPKGQAVSKEEIDLVIVPGLAFDLFGQRLGYGGGYYDRFLKDFSGLCIGFSYSDCVCYALPGEENDVRVDMLITEAGCERF